MIDRASRLTTRQLAHKKRARDLIEAVGGLDRAADLCRTGKSQLSDYENRNVLAFMPSDVIEDLEAVAHDAPVTRLLARARGFILVEMQSGADPKDLAKSVIDLMCEVGDVADAIRSGARDGKWTGAEIVAVLEQLDQLDQVSATLRVALTRLGEAVDAGRGR